LSVDDAYEFPTFSERLVLGIEKLILMGE
jgi:hypothetical protein